MRCLSHFLLFKTEKCYKNFNKQMKVTRICYFCVRRLIKLKKIDSLEDLLRENYYKNFIKTGSLSPKYFPLSIGTSE